MDTIDNKINMKQFGAFIAQMRKERGLTQKELAEKLFISDKAVSKWERGLSLPDISLLQPLAEELSVTVTELLQGKRFEKQVYTTDEAEELLSGLIAMVEKEHYALKGVPKEVKRKRMYLYLLELVLVALEMVWLWHSVPPLNIVRDVLVVELLPLLFGLYFFFFMKEKLPYYYDIDKISNYSDGGFRMNLPGVYFNNHNWQYILKTGRVYCFVTPVIYPFLYLFLVFVLDMLHHEEWLAMVNLPLCLIVVLGGLFIPMIIVGKKYE